MNPYLFVYGSLMAGIQSNIAILLSKNSHFLGEGLVQGKLFDLGHYPGLIHNPSVKSTVFGHVFELIEPPKMLEILDQYENVGQRFGQSNEYSRKECPVDFQGKRIKCWIYIYNNSIENLREITSGNYLEYLKDNKTYQNFLRSV